jgi:hypothetical protein
MFSAPTPAEPEREERQSQEERKFTVYSSAVLPRWQSLGCFVFAPREGRVIEEVVYVTFGGPLFEKSIQSYWVRIWKELIQKS